jgi:ribosome-interacting GTPase 1
LPANLTAEAKAKWQSAQSAKNPREKLLAYQEFLSLIPKHKGNEHLRAQIKTKIAELKDELATQRGKRAAGRSPWSVEREGAAQVMIFGPTQVGRSSLLRSLTNAQVESCSYEYSTQRPVPGMLQYEDIQIQLVELPAPQLVTNEERYLIQPDSVNLIRRCDGLILVVDLSNDPLRQLRLSILSLDAIRVSTHKPMTRVEVVPEKGAGEIRMATSGSSVSLSHEQVTELLHTFGIRNALVRIFGNATMDDVENAILENVTLYKPTLLVGNKLDRDSSSGLSSRFLAEAKKLPFPTSVVSCLTRQGLNTIGHQLFNCLQIVRVYTKEPNQSRPSDHPIVVRAGTTVRELALSIHTDLATKYRYSRIWGPSSKFAGERVGPDHVLGDQDTVEIHTN